MITETIDEMLDEINFTEVETEYVTVELWDGEKVTLSKEEYEQMVKDHKEYGEFLY